MIPSSLVLPATGSGSFEWWHSQLEWAAEARKDLLEERRYLLKAYRDKVDAVNPNAVRVNIEYQKTEQKRHQLFFRVPALRLRPHPRTLREATSLDSPTGQPRDLTRAVRIFREVLQYLAGPKGVHTKALMDMLMLDVLCSSGIGFVKVGFERFQDGTVPIEIGRRPLQSPGSILGLSVGTEPIMGQAPNIVADRYFAERISPGAALVPPDFTGNLYHRNADWLGFDFFMARHEAKRRGWRISDRAGGSGSRDDEALRLVELQRKGTRPDQLQCREVWCYAQRIYPDIAHPDLIQRLIFVEGMKEPVINQLSKDQVFDDRGRFVQGIRTLPIKVFTLRFADTWCPPSDCAISRRQADELSEARTMMIIHRKKAVPMRQINIQAIADPRVKDLIEKGEEYYGYIPADGPDPIMQAVAQAPYSRENFDFNDYHMADVNAYWAMGSNQQGVRESSARTATELALMQRATENRLSGEQQIAMDFWLELVETLAQLVQRYADHEDYVEIVGEQGARELAAWTKETIRGEFLFEAVPDSASRPDAAHDRDLVQNRYNLLANHPNINQEELLRETVEGLGGDPDRLVRQPLPPVPEKPRLSIALRGQDLNPDEAVNPQYQNVVSLLKVAGVPATLASPTQAQSPSVPIGPAAVVDRDRLRMAEAGEGDARAGGLTGVGTR